MNDMIRRNPPEPRTKRQPGHLALEEEAAMLRADPGHSYIVRSYPVAERNAAAQLRLSILSGRYAAFKPAGAFGVRTATENDKHGEPVVNVYAWFGELKEEEPEE